VASAFVRPSALQEASGGKVRCLVCERRCLLVEGGTGWCRTRVHREGKLLTLTYGAASLSANPIEKKPFYHFYPGSRALTAGSWSCNFGCPWCQNWDISRATPPKIGRFFSPQSFVRETLSPKTPWHVSAYLPAYRFEAPPTPLATLERAWGLGRGQGLEFVYIGDVPGHPYDNTLCPGCGALLVKRCGFELTRYALAGGRCPQCGRVIAGVGWDWIQP
jgi:hypothetical protein